MGLIYLTAFRQVDENRLNKVLDFPGEVMYDSLVNSGGDPHQSGYQPQEKNMEKTLDRFSLLTAYIAGDRAAVQINPRHWIRCLKMSTGWSANGCKTSGYGVGRTPQDAVSDGCGHGGFVGQCVYESRKLALSKESKLGW